MANQLRIFTMVVVLVALIGMSLICSATIRSNNKAMSLTNKTLHIICAVNDVQRQQACKKAGINP